MQDVILSPTDFVALVNQTLEFVYPVVAIEGELIDFKISKNRWVYFNLKDDLSVVKFFGTIYQMPGPFEDGMMVRVLGSPRLHQKFGFSVNVQSISPVGAGSIKKAADLLRAKLQAEGLFALERKRTLPKYPSRVGLVTAGNSAAYADFIKIAGERWGGVEIVLADVYVQGEQAPLLITEAIENINMLSNSFDVIAVVRGGGSAEDLSAFSDERVVRAVATSRIPTVVGIGHEIDESLAELAADVRASTPSNAAEVIFPDKKHEQANLEKINKSFANIIKETYERLVEVLKTAEGNLHKAMQSVLDLHQSNLGHNKRLIALYNPGNALKRGYAIVRQNNRLITKVAQLKVGDSLSIQISDGKISSTVNQIGKN